MQHQEVKLLKTLIKEHHLARGLVGKLVEVRKKEERKKILSLIQEIVALYAQHIKKENEEFFPKAFKYLSKEEEEKMSKEFMAFDAKMIHEKYFSLLQILLS